MENMKTKKYFINLIKYRKILTHILTSFIIVVAFSSFLTTGYSYKKYHKNIDELSKNTINQIESLLLEKVLSIKNEVVLMSSIIKKSIISTKQITNQDPNYIEFLINILQNDPFLTTIALAIPNGDFFAVMSGDIENSNHFYFTPLKQLPEHPQYIIRTIFQNGSSSQETWKYFNKEGIEFTSESITPASYDFRNDPWLVKMEKEKSLSWSTELLPRGPSKYMKKRSYGVTASDIIKNPQGDTVAISSVTVTLDHLSQFISNQKIGKNGSAFILDHKGKIEVPVLYGSSPSQAFTKSLLEDAYQEFTKTKANDFSLIKEGKKYLFSIHDFTFSSDTQWFIAIIVPFDDFFGSIEHTQSETILICVVTFFICILATYFNAQYISHPIVALEKQIDKIRDFDFTEPLSINSYIKEIYDLESSVKTMRSAMRSFGRYVPKEIVRTLIKYGNDVNLEGQKAEVTIFFSDIENFTTISETLPIEELMPILSDYFDVISKIILNYDGTIDKYIGDSVMSFWGAPLKIENHAEKACLAALKCLASVSQQNKWKTRFGIHTGEVIVGNIGTSERINYTIIGDTVNIASRLEAINKEYKTSIIISDVVYQKVGAQFVIRPIDFAAVKGKKNKLKIFELLGTLEGELAASPEQIELSQAFTKAYQLFQDERFKEAHYYFLSIEKKFPLDHPTKKYLERLKDYNDPSSSS